MSPYIDAIKLMLNLNLIRSGSTNVYKFIQNKGIVNYLPWIKCFSGEGKRSRHLEPRKQFPFRITNRD